MSLLVGVTLQSFTRFQHFGWILIPRIWMWWICMRRWRVWIFDFSGSAQEWGLGRKHGRDKLCLAVNSPTGFGIFNYFSTVSSGDDWIVHQIGFRSNQDLDDQTDVIRARLSNTKYDTIFSVFKDYNLTLVEGIHNIVIQKPGDSVKHFWKAPRQLDDHWPWVGLGS